MAVTKITYENKTAIQNDASVARKNKVVDEDMNEIKQVVNGNADELNTAQTNIKNLQSGQGTSSTDISNLKNRVSTLETDNTKNKSDINTLKSDNQTNKSNISTIKGQISDIQQEQKTQNTDIENLQINDNKQDELISKLKSAALNAETEESKSLHVTDANRFGSLEVLGNVEQETREGYNFLNITAKNKTSDGVTMTINEDGSVTFNGTATTQFGGFSLLASNTTWSADDFPYNKDLTLKCEGLVEGINFAVAEGDESGAWIRNILSIDGPNNKATGHPTKQANAKYIRVNFTILEGAILNNVTIYPMLYKGTDEKEFELYGATPSPDYPSEVKCLGSNKQLFDKSTAVEGLLQGDGTLSYSDNNYSTSDFIKVVPKKSYYKTITGSSRFKFFDEEKSPISSTYNDLIAPTKAQSFEIPENAHYIRFTFLKIYIDEIKIEEGTEATSYSPYGQGSTKISKINKNLAIAQNGIWYNYTNVSSDVQGYAYIARIKENSKITISKKNAGNRFAVFTSKEKIEVGAEMTQILVEQNTSRKEYTFNNVDGKWLFFGYYRGTDIEEAQLAGEEVQIEFEDTTTKYIEHQQEDYLLYIQQEMLKGDYFAKEADGWKEVHLRGKRYFLNDIENAGFDGSGNLLLVSQLLKNIAKLPSNNSADINVISNVSEHSSYQALYDGDVDYGIAISYVGSLGIRIKDCSSLEEYKNKLNNEDFYYYYYLAIPTKLACTEEQSAVLEELNNLDLYKPVTNIITAEDIALLKLKYALDVKTYVDNQIKYYKSTNFRDSRR